MMTIDELNRMTREQFTAALGWIFEDSPWVAERVFGERPFVSREVLYRAMIRQVERAGVAAQRALLGAHPDLGTRAKVSAASAREQACAGLDSLTSDEYAGFGELNRAYRDKFGIPFLYAVKGSTKKEIFAALRLRLESSPEEEFHQALTQVYRIARFRMESTIAE
jgi:2-oxo-4-hydroxy-4-carboxy-5-ureidoimidazoline decarboxylase